MGGERLSMVGRLWCRGRDAGFPAAPGQEPGAATMSPPSESVVAEGVPAAGQMEIVLAGALALGGRTPTGTRRVAGTLHSRLTGRPAPA